MERTQSAILLIAAVCASHLVHADYRDTIGHTALVEELNLRGLSVPTGAGIAVTQVEAREDTDRDGNLEPNEGYAPNPADSQFGSVTINDVSNLGQDPSGHATTVGRNLYGSSNSMATGIGTVDVYEAGDWLNNEGWGGGGAPSESNDVQNHSWVAFLNPGSRIERMDWAVENDDFVSVAGLQNADFFPNATEDIPTVYGGAFNNISVGRSDGLHVTGTTSVATGAPGRTKPEIVAPKLSSSGGTRFTSFVTPFVSAAAALLLEEAPALGANAARSQVIKAILLAAADKSPFPGEWDRTGSRPIDEVYGSGQLDIYEAYWLQRAGEQGTGSPIATRGWDYSNTSGSAVYTIEVPDGFELRNLSVLLTWNRAVTKLGNNYNYQPLADMSLSLDPAGGGSNIDSSDSLVDNIEHIWLDENSPLNAGSYELTVSTVLGTDYALAWRSELCQDYALWETVAFTGATPGSERDPEDDPEADGIPNRLEQAFGGDPEAYDRSILPQASIVEDGGSHYLELAVRQPLFKNGLTCTVESSGDLEGPWSSPAADFELVSIGPSSDPDFERYVYRRTTAVEAGGEVFVRVSVAP